LPIPTDEAKDFGARFWWGRRGVAIFFVDLHRVVFLSLNDHFSRGEIMFEDLPQYLRRNSTYDGQQAATSLELWRDGVPFLNEPLASVVLSGEFKTPDVILNRGDAFFILLDQAFNTIAGARGEIEMSARDFDDVDGQAQLVSMQGGYLRHVKCGVSCVRSPRAAEVLPASFAFLDI
jgi:hypothetical protein